VTENFEFFFTFQETSQIGKDSDIIIMKVLFVSTYVEQKNTREIIDMQKLNAEIEQIVAREDVLRREIAAIVAEIEGSLFAFSTKIYG